MRDFGAKELSDSLDRRQRVLDNVVQESRGDRDSVQLEVDEELGDRERMDQVRLARMAYLAPMFEGGENVGAPEQFDVGVRAVRPDFLQEILEANHHNRCLINQNA